MQAIKTPISEHRVVSNEEWLEARRAHLAREKEFTRERDQLSRERRELPWVRIEKTYTFNGPNGKETLAELFEGRSQLIVYHFMLGPGWKEGCPSCSFLSDHIDGAVAHLNARDVTLVVVSRAPLAEIEAFKKRMGWRFKWVSSYESDFNSDYNVSFSKDDLAKGEVYYNYQIQEFGSEEAPGASVFYKDNTGTIFHTYSAYARGLDILVGAYNYLDLAPKGRDEDALDFTMAWVRHHDKYENKSVVRPIRIERSPTPVLQPPRFEVAKPLFIAGLSRRYNSDDIAGIPRQWESFAPQIGHIPGQTGSAAYGVVSNFCASGDSFQYISGVEVVDLSGLPDEFSGIRLPSQQYAVFSHRENISKIRNTIDAIMIQWLPTSGKELADSVGFLERYGKEFDPQTGMGDVEIWVPVKE
jgi:predicted dithiol-disulfide oxidoreductase (DUF899 family)/predicted transcriptional regulator YdeE